MKDSVDDLSEELGPELKRQCRITDESIEFEPQSDTGFSVHFTDYGAEQVVSFGGWHDHFQDADEAARCFRFGLSTRCRLRVDCRGEFEYK